MGFEGEELKFPKIDAYVFAEDKFDHHSETKPLTAAGYCPKE
jgi:hypothetical protein